MAHKQTLFYGTLLVRDSDGQVEAYTLSGFTHAAFNLEVQACRERAIRNKGDLLGFKGYFTSGNEFGGCDYYGSELMDPDNFK